MGREKIKQGLERLSKLFKENGVECSPIHGKAGHNDHEACYVLGADATNYTMCTDGAKGTYLYMDNNGNIHKQQFTQGPEAHIWGDDEIIGEDEFLDYIEKLPEDNMANPKSIVSRLEDF